MQALQQHGLVPRPGVQGGELPLAPTAQQVVPARLKAQLAAFGERQRAIRSIELFFDDGVPAHQWGQGLHIRGIAGLLA